MRVVEYGVSFVPEDDDPGVDLNLTLVRFSDSSAFRKCRYYGVMIQIMIYSHQGRLRNAVFESEMLVAFLVARSCSAFNGINDCD